MTRDAASLHAAAIDHARAGRFEAAAEVLHKLLRQHPRHAAGWAMLGSVQMQLDRPADALASYERAVALAPGHAPSWLNRGNTLSRLGRTDAALASYDRAVAAAPDLVQGHSNRAQALNLMGRHEEALAAAERALALQPGHVGALGHRGSALYELERFDEALATHEAAARAAAGAPEPLTDVGMTLTALGRYDEAAAALDAAIAAAPTAPLPRYRRAHVRLLQRDFGGGWPDYEARWSTPLFTVRSCGQATPFRPHLTVSPRRDDLAGRRILAVAEQGVGDEVMFASVLPDLIADAASVTCVCDARLVGLFGHSFPGATVLGPEDAARLSAADFDHTVALGSLASVYRTRIEDFPGAPYLRPRPAVAAAWSERLGARRRRLRIGVSWRGGGKRTGAGARSMELETLRPLLERDDCEFVSLQYGDPRAEVAAFNATLANPIAQFPPQEIDDFEQLAGLVEALDLVVTVQTALAHVTGALGRTGLVMIPQRPEWRYGAAGSSLPWYGSLRIFRQAPGGGWPEVVERIVQALPAADGR